MGSCGRCGHWKEDAFVDGATGFEMMAQRQGFGLCVLLTYQKPETPEAFLFATAPGLHLGNRGVIYPTQILTKADFGCAQFQEQSG
jgi:hypothetical protein